MPLSKGAKVGIGVGAIAGIAAIVGVASAKAPSSPSPTPPPSSNYVLTLSSNESEVHAGGTVVFTANLTNNGSPVSGTQVTLTDTTTGTSSSTTTDGSGNADFNVTFNSPGTYNLQASAVV